MEDFSWLSRTELITSRTGLERLSQSHVLIVGLGGVGSFAAEFIARSGIGEITIVDGDVVDPTNRNRQLPALSSTHGQAKVQLMAERIKDINPEVKLHIYPKFVDPGLVTEVLNAANYNYLVDAIDSISPKVSFLEQAVKKNIPIVSSMGAGGRMDPTKIEIQDIEHTYNCPFAKLVRKRLHQKGVFKGFKAVFSIEKPLHDSLILTDGSNYKRSAYGTMSYMPATFGAICSSLVIRDLLVEKDC